LPAVAGALSAAMLMFIGLLPLIAFDADYAAYKRAFQGGRSKVVAPARSP
jgi:hypothetical protein